MADEPTAGQRAYQRRQERERLLGRAELLQEQQQAREEAAGREQVRSRQEFRRRTTSRAASSGDDVRQAAHAGLAGTSVDRAGARKLVLVSIAVLFTVNVIHEQRGGSKVGFYRRLWGTGVVGIFLAIMADFAPQVAGPLALVITLSQIPGKGNEALTELLGKVAPAAAKGQTGTTSSGRESPGLTRGG